MSRRDDVPLHPDRAAVVIADPCHLAAICSRSFRPRAGEGPQAPAARTSSSSGGPDITPGTTTAPYPLCSATPATRQQRGRGASLGHRDHAYPQNTQITHLPSPGTGRDAQPARRSPRYVSQFQQEYMPARLDSARCSRRATRPSVRWGIGGENSLRPHNCKKSGGATTRTDLQTTATNSVRGRHCKFYRPSSGPSLRQRNTCPPAGWTLSPDSPNEDTGRATANSTPLARSRPGERRLRQVTGCPVPVSRPPVARRLSGLTTPQE